MGYELLLDLGLIVLLGTLFAFVARLLRQPLFLGYVIAGLVMGPLFLNVIQDHADVFVLSELGVAFLLFAVGMEIDVSKLGPFKKILLVGGLVQITLTALVVEFLFSSMGVPFLSALYLGFMLAFSSTAVVVKALSSFGHLNDLEGRMAIGYLLVQDLVAILVLPALGNIENIYSAGALLKVLFPALALVVLGFVLSAWVFPRIFRFASKSNELFYLTTLSSFFLFLFLSAIWDFSIAVGAFIGGIAISRIDFSLQAQSIVHSLRDLFATVFFVSLGLQLTAFPTDWPLFLLMLGVVFVLNPLIFTGVNLWAGFGIKSALFIGFSLAQASEFSFILAAQGQQLGHLSPDLFNNVIWVILISIAATPYLVRTASYSTDQLSGWYLRLVPAPLRRYFARRLSHLDRSKDFLHYENHFVLAGGGVFGEQLAKGLPGQTIIVDSDPVRVRSLHRQGLQAVFASRHNREIWDHVRLSKARMLVCSIPRIDEAVTLVQRAKSLEHPLTIVARAHSFDHALQLYRAGADWVVMPQVLAVNTALQSIREFAETGRLKNGLRDEYLAWLAEKSAQEKKSRP